VCNLHVNVLFSTLTLGSAFNDLVTLYGNAIDHSNWKLTKILMASRSSRLQSRNRLINHLLCMLSFQFILKPFTVFTITVLLSSIFYILVVCFQSQLTCRHLRSLISIPVYHKARHLDRYRTCPMHMSYKRSQKDMAWHSIASQTTFSWVSQYMQKTSMQLNRQ